MTLFQIKEIMNHGNQQIEDMEVTEYKLIPALVTVVENKKHQEFSADLLTKVAEGCILFHGS